MDLGAHRHQTYNLSYSKNSPLSQPSLCFSDVSHYILKMNVVKRANGSDLFSCILWDISLLQSGYPCLPVPESSVPCAAEPHFPLPWPQMRALIRSHHISANPGQPRHWWLRAAQLSVLHFWEAVPPQNAGMITEAGGWSTLPQRCRSSS